MFTSSLYVYIFLTCWYFPYTLTAIYFPYIFSSSSYVIIFLTCHHLSYMLTSSLHVNIFLTSYLLSIFPCIFSSSSYAVILLTCYHQPYISFFTSSSNVNIFKKPFVIFLTRSHIDISKKKKNPTKVNKCQHWLLSWITFGFLKFTEK